MRVVWTEPAVRDLAAAREYIARDNPPAAERQVATIVDAVLKLQNFPETGRPGRRPGTRELVVPRTPYIVAYRSSGDALFVLRVMHGRQRWPQNL